MQIKCEKCETSYAVDDGLIPATGAPVQCTKCGNLFTAFPSAPKSSPGKTVMMFADQVQGAPQRITSSGMPAAPATSSATVASAPPAPQPIPQTPPRAPGIPTGTVPFAEPERRATGPVAVSASAPTLASTAITQPEGPAPIAKPVVPSPAAPSAFGPAVGAVSPPSRSGIDGAAAAMAVAPPPEGVPDLAPSPSRPGKVTQMFFAQGESVDRLNDAAQRGEANRKPGQTQMFMATSDLEEKLVQRSRMPLYLGLGAVALVLVGLLLASILPSVLGPAGADRRSAADHAKAVALLARDDSQSVATADEMLSQILKGHPHYLDAQGDRALALVFRANDLDLRARRIYEAYDALQRKVTALTKRKEPADWAKLVNDDIAQMKKMHEEYDPLRKEQAADGALAYKLAEEARKADPRDLAALRALAFYYADNGDADRARAMDAAYSKVLGKKDGWSELALAELDAAGDKSSADKRQDGKSHLTEALARDPSLTRARFLRVELDVEGRDLQAAKDDATALTAQNPAHEGGARLVAWLEESLAREAAEKQEREAHAAAEATGEAKRPRVAQKSASKASRKRPRRRW
ncbi:MAG: zinc-ribbon domain-containing protein [Deltaproteobacteria bacterium]